VSAVALPVSVEVPASSANLGPGFDALAAALDVTLTVTAVPREAQRVVASGDGAGELPTDDTNLIWRGVVAYCERFGADAPDITLHSANDIPLERGMGSSAAAAVAGVALAREVLAAGGTDADLVTLAAELEGHPDNAAAAMLGGLVVCADGLARRLEPATYLRPVVCVPRARQSTAQARGVLPETVSLGAAAGNAGRVAMVLAGLAGHIAWEPALMHDVLHEPPRFRVMTESGALVARLREQGIGACLSGAGPTVLAIVPTDDAAAVDAVTRAAADGWEVTPIRWHRRGASRVSTSDRSRAEERQW
jgi:homoserine kinase